MNARRVGLLVLAAAVCLLAANDRPAEAKVTNARAYVCDRGQCKIYAFTVSLIGKDSKGRGILLTNAHCVQGANRVVIGQQGKWVDVTIVSVSNQPGVDVAILAQSDPGNIDRCCTPLAKASPGQNEKVAIRAFTGGDRYSARFCNIVYSSAGELQTSCPVEEGESGGELVLNEELIGLLRASGYQPFTGRHIPPGIAVPVEVIRGYVQRTLGEIPACDCGKQQPPATTGDAPPPPPEKEDPPKPTTEPAPTTGVNLEQRVTTLETGLRELTIRVQRIEGGQDSMKKDVAAILKSIESIEKTTRESQLVTQKQTVEIQRISKEIETVKQMAGRIGFKVRVDPTTGKYSLVPETK